MATEYLTVEHFSTKDLTRIFSKVTIFPELQFNETSCWIWSTNRSKEGYGLIGWNHTTQLIHRLLFAWLIHPLPKGFQHGEIDHLCKRPSCCNPLHLEFVTRQINTLRSRNVGGVNARKTTCPQGHPLSTDNIYTVKGRWRTCRTCALTKQKGRFEANPEKVRQYKREWARAHYVSRRH